MDLLHLIAKTLLKYETITKEQIDYLVENGCMPEEEDDVLDVTLNDLTLEELKDMAREKEIKGYSKMKKDELIEILKEEDE